MAEQCRSECWWVEDAEWSRAGASLRQEEGFLGQGGSLGFG